MEIASKFVHLYEKPVEDTCDSNVISLSFSRLANWKNTLSAALPITCDTCRSYLTTFHKIYTRAEITEYRPEDMQFKPKIISTLAVNEPKARKKMKKPIIHAGPVEEDEKKEEDGTPKMIKTKHRNLQEQLTADNLENEAYFFWVCEFCGSINQITQKDFVQPKHPDFYFLTRETPQQISNEEDITVIFCLDNSGSMSSSLEVQNGNQALMESLYNQELELLRGALSPYEFEVQAQALRTQGNNRHHVTRKQCIIKAIQLELNKMKDDYPRRKVGIVVFNDDVIVAGDGKYSPAIISGNDLLDFKKCRSTGITAKNLMTQFIQQSFQTVINVYKDHPEKGKTALGPALVASVGLASTGKPGSMVILCTDGLANVGFGDLALGESDDIRCYDKIARLAEEEGVMINIMTIVGEQSKLEVLGPMVSRTNGNIERVDPSAITQEFRAMLTEKSLGRKAAISFYLPPFLKFQGEDARNLYEGGSVCVRELGNISETSKISFRFAVKPYMFKQKVKKLMEGSKALFQAGLVYTMDDGKEMLNVISMQVAMTFSEEKAFEYANLGAIATHAASEIAELMTEKKEREMIERQNKWNVLMDRIREVKNKGNRMNDSDEISIRRFRTDTRKIEEMTMRLKRKGPNRNDNGDDRDDATVFAHKMRRRNYR